MTDLAGSTDLVLGIDTGGTYTDGVLLDYATRAVVSAHKVLTTKRDFAIGVENVLSGMRIDNPAAVKLVSISTTLATNAIAEGSTGRGRRVALLLLGYDPELIAKFKMGDRFGTDHFAFFAGGHDLYGRPQAPLDVAALTAWVQAITHDVDAIAISGYFSPLNPEHEHEAFAAVRSVCNLPVVMGHQLSSKLGSIERATTAALNASLLGKLQEFVVAVRRALARRNIDAPLMVMRGDGTLMSADFALATPVETVHSGPAASAIGGRFLAQLDSALVVDVGGTTTDIALVEQGQVTVDEDGARIDGYKTAIQAAHLLSIPLGGDSHIHRNASGKLAIGPKRVVPLAHLAHLYPAVEQQLKALHARLRTLTDTTWLHYWFLLRNPQNEDGYTDRERAILALLRDGPKPVPQILKYLNLVHPGQIDAGALWRKEILGQAGLTPTDLLHIEDRYTPWNTAAAVSAAAVFYPFLFPDQDVLQSSVWQQMTEIIVRAIVTFLTAHELPAQTRSLTPELGEWFVLNSLYADHPHLATQLHLRLPLIGIGAAAGVVLDGVADALHTKLVLPPHYQVANAVGAVAGSVVETEEVLVYPHLSEGGLRVLGHYAQGSDGRSFFTDHLAALEHARELGRKQALQAAQRAGAVDPQVEVVEIPEGVDMVRIRAKGVGNPRLAQ